MENRPIILSKFGSAVFLAEMKFAESRLTTNSKTKKQLISERDRHERWKYENKKREFVLQYLKEHYPDKDYAEKYDKINKWNQPLNEHNERSLHCQFLKEDKRHCNQKHKSGCYTCCAVCYSPGLCEWSDCIIFND